MLGRREAGPWKSMAPILFVEGLKDKQNAVEILGKGLPAGDAGEG